MMLKNLIVFQSLLKTKKNVTELTKYIQKVLPTKLNST